MDTDDVGAASRLVYQYHNSIPHWAENQAYLVRSPVWVPRFVSVSLYLCFINQRRPTHMVTFSMVRVGASRKSPNEKPWEMLNQIQSRPIGAYL